MSKNLKEKLAILHQHYPTLKSKYRVQRIGIFGSVARGTAKRGSDIDILVELKQPIGMFAFFSLENYLQKILRQRVDLVTKKALKPATKKGVLTDTIYV